MPGLAAESITRTLLGATRSPCWRVRVPAPGGPADQEESPGFTHSHNFFIFMKHSILTYFEANVGPHAFVLSLFREKNISDFFKLCL